MSTLSKLRRLVLRQDVSVREASRRLGISRNTATKWGAWDRSKGVKGRACGPLRGGPCPRFAAGRASRPCDP